MPNQPQYWIGTSWKMNKTLREAREFANGMVASEPPCDDKIQAFVIPPFTSLREVKTTLDATPVKVGAQNMHWADHGAWTGEISPLMLTDCGIDMVELGHSERRAHFGETNEHVGLKVEAAVRHGLTPLICIGETLEQRDTGQADAVLANQVETALEHLQGTQVTARILFAYEPVWAIGAGGIPASAEYADNRQARIKSVAAGVLGRPVPCLYGGSVTQDNCQDLISRQNIDGLFIGRAAWDVSGYLEILTRCRAAITPQPDGEPS